MRARGFTLVEVLTALAVLAILLPVAMHGISLAARLGAQSLETRTALALAQQKLDELVVTGSWRSGALDGDFGPDMPEYRFAAEISPWVEDTADVLTLKVLWDQQDRERSVSLSTLVQTEGR